MSRWERVNCASFVAILATLLLLAGSYLPSAHGSTEQPAATAAVKQTIPSVFRFKPAVTVADARAWAESTLAGSGVTLASNVTMVFTSKSNCGADLSTLGMGGCTYHLEDGSIVMVISPELAWTQAGSHILLHEVAHTLGVANECAAEEWAHQFEDEPYWSYPACNVY